MSRAYRISVKESVARDIRAGDEICTQLELLGILSPEAMGQLLRAELGQRGFVESDDGKLVRQQGDLTVTVDPCNGEVSVKTDAEKSIVVEGEREATAWDDVGPLRKTVEDHARELLAKELEKKIEKENDKLQEKATASLEKHLNDLQPELASIVNKVTREALKQKAATLGTITEIAEDEKSGSMTIKIEV